MKLTKVLSGVCAVLGILFMFIAIVMNDWQVQETPCGQVTVKKDFLQSVAKDVCLVSEQSHANVRPTYVVPLMCVTVVILFFFVYLLILPCNAVPLFSAPLLMYLASTIGFLHAYFADGYKSVTWSNGYVIAAIASFLLSSVLAMKFEGWPVPPRLT